MNRIKEAFQQAKLRVNPEGLAISGTLTGASIFAIVPLQAAFTYLVNEVGREIPTGIIKLAAVGSIALINAVSIGIETKALKQEVFSASPIASTLNVATGKSTLSSSIGHTINFVQSYGLNPVHIVNVGLLVTGDQGRMFIENAIGVGLALGLWNIGFNSLILKHQIEPVVKKMRKIRQAISKRF